MSDLPYIRSEQVGGLIIHHGLIMRITASYTYTITLSWRGGGLIIRTIRYLWCTKSFRVCDIIHVMNCSEIVTVSRKMRHFAQNLKYEVAMKEVQQIFLCTKSVRWIRRLWYHKRDELLALSPAFRWSECERKAMGRRLMNWSIIMWPSPVKKRCFTQNLK